MDVRASAVDGIIGIWMNTEVDEKRDDALYNSADCPIPFHKAQDLRKVPKKLASEPGPELVCRRTPVCSLKGPSAGIIIIEEAYIDDAIGHALDDDTKKEDTDTDDMVKDSTIKAPKPKKKVAPAKKTEKFA
ncbi:hypothetical protein CPB84DRAFT_1844773 [Gymnopilus junonius]|uniref:Uncharacterized protein n=1 Tax=Gymnopilus junonius TaxID=109634 RepID=A0A9P5NUL4_GYMJU|nr:hypothetical protein CPB84DRAFT_1844773 [Gymnopilus junonius]